MQKALVGEILGAAALAADRRLMKLFNTLDELLRQLNELNWDAAIFVKIPDWDRDPLTADLLYLEGDNELEDIVDAASHLPRIAFDQGRQQLLDLETLRDVVNFEAKRNPSASVDEFANAIDYYREKDDFFDPDAQVSR